MWIGVVSLFPEMFEAITRYGVTGRAVDQGLLEVDFWNPRDYATDKHRTVDDRPYGGGPGMLMKVATLRPAIAEARRDAERRGCAPARTRQGGAAGAWRETTVHAGGGGRRTMADPPFRRELVCCSSAVAAWRAARACRQGA